MSRTVKWDPDWTPEEVAAEEWRDVKGYEGVYEVSTLGRIRAKKDIYCHGSRTKVRITCGRELVGQYTTSAIYYRLVGIDSREYNTVAGDVVVAEAYIDNPDPQRLICISHKDGNVQNNRVSNLEWVESTQKRRKEKWREPEVNWVYEAYHLRANDK